MTANRKLFRSRIERLTDGSSYWVVAIGDETVMDTDTQEQAETITYRLNSIVLTGGASAGVMP